MITGRAIGTLVVFIFSIICVIRPVHIPIPFVRGHKDRRIRIPVNLTTAPILSIAILWAAQCLGPTQIRNGIVGTEGVKPYNILILFFSLAYMAITLDITGVLRAAAFWVSNKGGSDGRKLFFYFYLMLTGLSVLLGNDPVILSGTVFLVYYTRTVATVPELNPIPWLMSEFAAANTASMVLFVGNPTNVVICEGFSVNNVAFTAYTILPFLACNVLCFLALRVQFGDGRYLPPFLEVSGNLDVGSALSDRKGAWVGSFFLGTCLVVIIVVSFFGVDVWKVSLPFAVGKFLFDFAWDHYRHTHPSASSVSLELVSTNPLTPEAVSINPLTPEAVSTSPLTDSMEGPLEPGLAHRGMLATDGTGVPSSENVEVNSPSSSQTIPENQRKKDGGRWARIRLHFPTFFTALPRLPFALIPFAFSQFILIEALDHQGWINVFATWLVKATHRQMHPTIWLIGTLGVILCNLAGTNIGATILLTKVVVAAEMPAHTFRAAAISLAVASNIGAVSFTFSASLAGLLWKAILEQKNIFVKQTEFAKWNLLPLLVMTVAGLAVVSAEMAVLYR